jgi:hypothetical protein
MEQKTTTTKVSSHEMQSTYLNRQSRQKRGQNDLKTIQTSINFSRAQNGVTSLTSASRGAFVPQISYNDYIKKEMEGFSGKVSAQRNSFGFVEKKSPPVRPMDFDEPLSQDDETQEIINNINKLNMQSSRRLPPMKPRKIKA